MGFMVPPNSICLAFISVKQKRDFGNSVFNVKSLSKHL